MTHTALNQLSSVIKNLAAQKSGLFLVAIDGRSGSGKSTLANRLCDELDALIIEGDDFFAGGVEVLDSSASQLANICIDWRSQRDALRELHARGTVSYLPFNWDAFDGTKSSVSKQVRSKAVVILEGVYSARPELRDLIDFSVLIDLPEELRMYRLIAREREIGPWERQWHSAEDWYFQNQSRREDFDAVLNWVSNHQCSLNLKQGRKT